MLHRSFSPAYCFLILYLPQPNKAELKSASSFLVVVALVYSFSTVSTGPGTAGLVGTTCALHFPKLGKSFFISQLVYPSELSSCSSYIDFVVDDVCVCVCGVNTNQSDPFCLGYHCELFTTKLSLLALQAVKEIGVYSCKFDRISSISMKYDRYQWELIQYILALIFMVECHCLNKYFY